MADHLDQLARALLHIEANLDRPLRLEAAAREAGMSPFHFSRVFSAIVGETASEYSRKRRLSKAAELLLGSGLPILAIALETGFESQESFTRAFSRRYGASPARFRRRGRPFPARDAPALDRGELAARAGGRLSLLPRFAEAGRRLLLGLGCENSGRRVGIPRLWPAFLGRMGEIEGSREAATYGVYLYDHGVPEEGRGEDFPFRYLAAAEIAAPPASGPPRGMELLELEPARYAIFEHRGPLRDLGSAYRYIYKTWFPRQPESLAPAPFFERRGPGFPGDGPGSLTEIWIPLGGD